MTNLKQTAWQQGKLPVKHTGLYAVTNEQTLTHLKPSNWKNLNDYFKTALMHFSFEFDVRCTETKKYFKTKIKRRKDLTKNDKFNIIITKRVKK